MPWHQQAAAAAAGGAILRPPSAANSLGGYSPASNVPGMAQLPQQQQQQQQQHSGMSAGAQPGMGSAAIGVMPGLSGTPVAMPLGTLSSGSPSLQVRHYLNQV